MAALAGPVKTVSIAGREFRCVGDADWTVQLGGYTNERLVNGDGSTRPRKTPVVWKASGGAVEVDPDNEDLEFLESVKNGVSDVPIVITMADDNSYSGVGNLEGELSYSPNNASASFELTGEGRLKKL